MGTENWSMSDLIDLTHSIEEEFVRDIKEKAFDVRKLPAEKIVRGIENKQTWVIFLVFSLMFFGGPIFFFIKVPEILNILPAAFVASFFLSFLLLLLAVNKIQFVKKIRISKEEVSFYKKNLFGTREWSEKFSSYQGVIFNAHARSKGRYSFKLELYHANADRCILLLYLPWKDPALKVLAAFTRALGLPALKMTKGQITTMDQ